MRWVHSSHANKMLDQFQHNTHCFDRQRDVAAPRKPEELPNEAAQPRPGYPLDPQGRIGRIPHGQVIVSA